MFRLQKIKAHNFWIFEDVNIDLSTLDENSVIFVEGVNHDSTDSKSNWSGKTTLIIDLFRWIIEDKYPRLRAVSDVVGEFDSYASGTLVYIDSNNNKLIISRYRKHPQYKTCLMIKWKGEWLTGERQKESEDMLTRIIGITPSQYIAGTLFSHAPEEELLLKSPAIRNQELAEVWGITKFDEAAKFASKVCATLDKQVAEINSNLELNVGLRKRIRDEIISYKEAAASFAEDRQAKINELDERIKAHAALIEEEDTIVGKIKIAKNDIARCNESIAELRRRHVDTAPIIDKITAERGTLSGLRAKGKNYVADIEALNDEIEKIESGYKKGMVCSECGNTVSKASIAVITEQRRKKIRTIEVLMSELNGKIEAQKKVIHNLLEEMKGYNVEEINDKIAKVSSMLVKRQDELSKYKHILEDIKTTRIRHDEMVLERKALVTGKSDTLLKKAASAKSELDKINNTLTMLVEKKQELESQFDMYKLWAGPNGFKRLRNLVLGDKIELMNTEFSNHLKYLTDSSISGQWSVMDNGDIVCDFYDNIVGKEKHFKGFSGAQRNKIFIAQSLSNTMLYAPNIGHINIDEKLDAFIDSVGIQIIFKYMKQFSGIGKTVFLTSHLAGVQQHCDATLRIERKNNRATVQLFA